MRLKILIVCIFTVCILCIWRALHAPQIQGRSLEIHIINVTSRSPTNQIFIKIENISKNAVTYDFGRTVCIAFLHDGRWETNNIGHFFTEEVYLWPACSDQFINLTKIPIGAKAVKVGVSYVSLTWRGLFAFKLAGMNTLSQVSEFLHGLDESKRSITEWSEILYLDKSN